MVKLSLRRTLEEIDEQNARLPNSFGMLRTINRFNPRHWMFEFVIPDGQNLLLTINSDPPLSAQEFSRLFDGSIPELFNATAVQFSTPDGIMLSSDLTDKSRTNTLHFKNEKIFNVPGLVLAGYGNNKFYPYLSDLRAVHQYLLGQTWIGSQLLAKKHSDLSIHWKVLTTEENFYPQPRYTEVAKDHLYVEREYEILSASGQHVGHAYLLLVHTMEKGDFTVFHTRLGPFNSHDMYRTIVDRARCKTCRIFVEFSENQLDYDAVGRIGPWDPLKQVTRFLVNATTSQFDKPEFAEFTKRVSQDNKQKQAKLLIQRQERVMDRPSVHVGRREIGCEPVSENEVIVLLAKAEVMGALPLAHFELLEYTPRVGIDALANIQINKQSARQPLAPVEIELHFENFFDHGHPLEQTSMIVCWGFRRPGAAQRFHLRPVTAGLYSYFSAARQIWVLVLSECPELSVKKPRSNR